MLHSYEDYWPVNTFRESAECTVKHLKVIYAIKLAAERMNWKLLPKEGFTNLKGSRAIVP